MQPIRLRNVRLSFIQIWQHPIPSAYGHDPYNSLDQHAMAQRVVRMWPGPLTRVATRNQQSWDFCPGDVASKVRYYENHGMHALPLRGLMVRQAG